MPRFAVIMDILWEGGTEITLTAAVFAEGEEEAAGKVTSQLKRSDQVKKLWVFELKEEG